MDGGAHGGRGPGMVLATARSRLTVAPVNQPLFRKPTAADRRDRWSWHLGRISGIPTRIHASFALVLVWIGISTWSAAHSGAAVLFGLLFALAIFACVLLHEFGHALVARRFGIETRRITLLPVGGVAELERAPEDPRAELWIAAAGPAVNFLIAAVLGAVGLATGMFAGGGVASVVFSGLVWANVMLGAFNLVPAFPMDGGRVFRALAAQRYGRLRATEYAAKLGRVLALGFGAWSLVSGNPIGALVAAFVYVAAGRELSSVRAQAAWSSAAGPGRWSTPSRARFVNAEDVRVADLQPGAPRVVYVRRR